MFETNKINDFSSEVIAYCFKGIDAKKALNFKVCFRSYSSQMHLFCLNLLEILGITGIQNQKAWSYLGFTWEMYFFFFCFFLLLILELFLVRLMNSYLTFSSLLFQVCVCYVLNHIFTARTLKTLHKYGNTYLNSTEFIAVCMQK